MIPKPRMILKPKNMILKPTMIPKPRTTGNQGSSKNVICKNVIVPTPPHPNPPIWRRCHVECSCTCAKRRNAAARTLLSPPTPPHPPRVWRRCHAECSSTDLGCRVMRILVAESRGVWLRNRLFLVAESYLILVAEWPKFGCGIAEIWLQNRPLFVGGRDYAYVPSPYVKCNLFQRIIHPQSTYHSLLS